MTCARMRPQPSMARKLTSGTQLSGHARQCGQALVESLVALFALAVLWVGLNWLGHYQDMALSMAHASRYAAFLATRVEPSELQGDERGRERVQRYFTGDAHRWRDRRGATWVDPEVALGASWHRDRPLSARSQPGADTPHATTLRQDWSLEDQGIVQAQVLMQFHDRPQPGGGRAEILGLGVFDQAYPSLRRSSYILSGAGHAPLDSVAQERVSESRLAWAGAEGVSRNAGAMVADRAAVVDTGWSRAAPDFDWLQPWSGYVPGHLIEDYEGEAK